MIRRWDVPPRPPDGTGVPIDQTSVRSGADGFYSKVYNDRPSFVDRDRHPQSGHRKLGILIDRRNEDKQTRTDTQIDR